MVGEFGKLQGGKKLLRSSKVKPFHLQEQKQQQVSYLFSFIYVGICDRRNHPFLFVHNVLLVLAQIGDFAFRLAFLTVTVLLPHSEGPKIHSESCFQGVGIIKGGSVQCPGGHIVFCCILDGEGGGQKGIFCRLFTDI